MKEGMTMTIYDAFGNLMPATPRVAKIVHLCRNNDIAAEWDTWCDPPNRTGEPRESGPREVTGDLDRATCGACLHACASYGALAAERAKLVDGYYLKRANVAHAFVAKPDSAPRGKNEPPGQSCAICGYDPHNIIHKAES